MEQSVSPHKERFTYFYVITQAFYWEGHCIDRPLQIPRTPFVDGSDRIWRGLGRRSLPDKATDLWNTGTCFSTREDVRRRVTDQQFPLLLSIIMLLLFVCSLYLAAGCNGEYSSKRFLYKFVSCCVFFVLCCCCSWSYCWVILLPFTLLYWLYPALLYFNLLYFIKRYLTLRYFTLRTFLFGHSK